ncbi:SDR family oxidoreductase, partial [Acinetobacter baumannii]|uniref:SDR family oxidoreductase n=1 Tax=Acinetobacter baumannii TaxID=470 RepID=UPI0013D6B0CD
SMFSAEQFEKIAKTLPLRKLGRPGDIANAVVFLSSASAGHITGQVLSVSGGYSMVGLKFSRRLAKPAEEFAPCLTKRFST